MQAAVQPRKPMNRSLYASVSTAWFADLAPLVIHSPFPYWRGRRGEGREGRQGSKDA